jgi:hypothetical protein
VFQSEFFLFPFSFEFDGKKVNFKQEPFPRSHQAQEPHFLAISYFTTLDGGLFLFAKQQNAPKNRKCVIHLNPPDIHPQVLGSHHGCFGDSQGR